MTERLYLTDPYAIEFEAGVVDCFATRGGFGITLDRTCFHPEGGGQPGDRGTLGGQEVLDLQLNGLDVVHVVAAELKGRVQGQVDWERRFDFMQQHSGQHIFSQAAMRLLKAETVGFRLASPVPSVDLACPALDEEGIAAVEELTNRVIFENRPIRSYFVSDPARLAALPLRNRPPEKGIGPEGVRIVEVEDFECVPCGGTHCTRTGEVGLFVVKDWSRKGEAWHIDFLCGGRALADYRWKRSFFRRMRQLFNTPEDQAAEKVEQTAGEAAALRRSLELAQGELLGYQAAALAEAAQPALGGRARLAVKTLEGDEAKQARLLVSKLAAVPSMVMLVAQMEAKATLLAARSDDVDYDMGALVKKACAAFGVRGGGGAKMAQIGGLEAGQMPEIMGWLRRELA
jgi:alanyl-tRNA synthetase